VIQPVNRYIEVAVTTTVSSKETTILLPTDFKPHEERYRQVQIQSWAPDVRFADRLYTGCEAIIDHNMIEEIKVGNELLNVIQDNYVIALLTK
jgi:hypothetical protein